MRRTENCEGHHWKREGKRSELITLVILIRWRTGGRARGSVKTSGGRQPHTRDKGPIRGKKVTDKPKDARGN